MALNGINLALAWNGQEAIWERVGAHLAPLHSLTYLILCLLCACPPTPCSTWYTENKGSRSVCVMHDGSSPSETETSISEMNISEYLLWVRPPQPSAETA